METMRPGVYTSYTVTPVFAGNRGRSIGIAAHSQIEHETVQRIASLSEGMRLFGETGAMAEMLRAIYANASPVVYGVSVSENTTAAYENALEKLLEKEEPYLLCTDSTQNEVFLFLSEKLSEFEQRGKEKLGVCGSESVAEAVSRANLLNTKRICVSYPAMFLGDSGVNLSPAVLTALISSEEDVRSNLNGRTVKEGFFLEGTNTEEEINLMIKNGVCVFEQTGEYLELIRGGTTSTKDEEGKDDNTFRSLSTILILDTVIPSLRQMLKDRIKNTLTSLESVRSLLVCSLSKFKEENLISEYEMPVVTRSEEDSTVCIVRLAFTVAQGIQQVYLTAQISI